MRLTCLILTGYHIVEAGYWHNNGHTITRKGTNIWFSCDIIDSTQFSDYLSAPTGLILQ